MKRLFPLLLLIAGCVDTRYEYPDDRASHTIWLGGKTVEAGQINQNGHDFFIATNGDGIAAIHHPACQCMVKAENPQVGTHR
jgi:hypothetical protein